MSTKTYTGACAAVAQKNTFTFAGTWLVGETVVVTYGSKAWTYTLASATIATFLAALNTAYAALDATLYAEFAEQTCANPTGATLTLTSNTAGRPFTVTLSTASVAGTINAGASTTGTATTASSGSADWSCAANWSPSGVPVNGDAVNLTGISTSILYGLAQSAVTLLSLTIDSTFTGLLGLADNNPAGFSEYRGVSLAVGATTCTIGAGSGAGSGRLRIAFGSVQTACTIYSTTTPYDPNVTETVLLTGSHASNALYVVKGLVNSTMVLSILSASYLNTVATDVTLKQSGTVATLTQSGGAVTVTGNVVAWNVTGGTPELASAATLTTLKVLTSAASPLTFKWTSNGTITTGTFSAGATLDTHSDLRARTLTTGNFENGVTINDPNRTITITTCNLRACGFEDVTIHRGRDIAVSL